MYKLDQITEIHFEITSLCQARCPMCARNIQGGPDNPFLEIHEIFYDDFLYFFEPAFIKQLKKFYMCGNFGDPVVARDTLRIFEYIRSHNTDCSLSMNTNGSARDDKFWSSLAQIDVHVRFGIDGLQDTHSRYRHNTHWDKIIKNAKTFIQNGGYAIWDMLVFRHNEHQIDECRLLSESLNFKEFHSKHTRRFKDNKLQVIDVDGVGVDVLYPTEKSLSHIPKIKNNLENMSVDCKAKNESSIYVGANGNITPCCWIDREFLPVHNPSRIDILTRIGQAPNIRKNTLKEIFDTDYFTKIENTWKCSPLKECATQCGKFKPFEAQYES